MVEFEDAVEIKPKYFMLTGGGGTGKSEVYKIVREILNAFELCPPSLLDIYPMLAQLTPKHRVCGVNPSATSRNVVQNPTAHSKLVININAGWSIGDKGLPEDKR